MNIAKRNTLILKGGGIILLLIHHLFYSDSSRLLYDDIVFHGYGLVNEIGKLSRFCVALFVFLSGYGVSVTYNGNWKDFYKRRYKKLFLNYWVIWLIFVPISVFVFHRTFVDVYNQPIALNAVLDFLGLIKLTGQYGYNPTWWFMSCIIVLYLIFPILDKYYNKIPFFILTLGVFVSFAAFIPFIQPISNCLLPFLTGMFVAHYPDEKISQSKVWVYVLSLGMLFVMRNYSGRLIIAVDSLICVGLVFFLNRIKLPKWLDACFANMGEHSMNIFFFHTFLFSFWFKDYTYMTRNPLLIFLSLLIPCYLISIILEFIKKKIGFYRLLK